jgi:GDP-D-mannose dehydratase
VLGWEPRIGFEAMVAEMVDADMSALRAEVAPR